MLAKHQAQERELEEQEGGMRPGMIRRLSTPLATQPPKPHSYEGLPRSTSAKIEDSCSTISPPRDEWSSEVHKRPAGSSNLQEEIDRQFAAMRTGIIIQQTESEDEEEVVPKPSQLHHSPTADDTFDESEDEVVEMVTPIHPTKGLAHHDGNVQSQKLEDTTGVKVPDRHDILIPKPKTRASLFVMSSSDDENTLKKANTASPVNERESYTHNRSTPAPSVSLLSDKVPRSPNELLAFKVLKWHF